MPKISIAKSALLPGTTPIELHYRDVGSGRPLVFLHGGWGYQIYPFDRQIGAFNDRFRIVIPDRTGYGGSMRLAHVPTDFHSRAAAETICLLDALNLERPILWGHSDGAVIGARIGLSRPDRISALILEAFHYYRVKPGSRAFFEQMANTPESFGERVVSKLAQDHGDEQWRKLLLMNGEAWLRIADEATDKFQDLYDGELSRLSVPTLFIHGSNDPRTEPGELDAVRAALPEAQMAIIEGGGHSPHSESASADDATQIAGAFLDSHSILATPLPGDGNRVKTNGS